MAEQDSMAVVEEVAMVAPVLIDVGRVMRMMAMHM